MTIEEDIKKIEEELVKTKYNKATEKHIGIQKAKLARLKEKKASSKKAGGGKGFSLRKEGDGSVVMVGFPSVGKSTIINAITSAKSETASYEFTTTVAIPGMLIHKGAFIQIVDIPGIITGAAEGRGRGREVLSAVRATDLVLIIADVEKPSRVKEIIDELEKGNIRLDKRPPRIRIEKKESGSLHVIGESGLSFETIKEVLKTFGIINADIIFRERITIDQLVDYISKRCTYLSSLIILNKIDKLTKPQLEKLEREMRSTHRKDVVSVSAMNGVNIMKLKDKIYEKLNFIQVYTIRKDASELGEPLIIKKDSTIKQVCRALHKDLVKKFKYALINGKSARFKNQRVGFDHIVKDQDVITVVLER